VINLVSTYKNQKYEQNINIREIGNLDKRLAQHFKGKFFVEPALTRQLVSFQANKKRPVYRWYKFKEAFSASLIDYFFRKYRISKGRILDPFAGSGTSLFAASEIGIDADGIELLSIGKQIIETRKLLESIFTFEDFDELKRWSVLRVWKDSKSKASLPELRITTGAYPERTKESIEKYLGACQKENSQVQAVLRFALLCALESMSYTRKDGQYLRWDYRSGRKQGNKIFDKGKILSFDQAVLKKINEITVDLAPNQQTGLFHAEKLKGKIHLFQGSCLKILPKLPDEKYNAIITSPPYCNRYDYTRTYALELALLGTDEQGLTNLRQEMLSCTVENRIKDLLKINPSWTTAITIADNQELLQTILKYLNEQKVEGLLNNNGIPRMVKGYFYEMACVIAECARVLKPNSLFFMVNDNVRYAGVSVSVDMILSDFAEKLGFCIENILVLPNGKGNSSQQMGKHGREALRKCVYVWRKP
jgi:DNA modification methylase